MKQISFPPTFYSQSKQNRYHMIIQLNNQFEMNGIPGYNINGVIADNQVIPYEQK